MNKVASPRELQVELKRLVELTQLRGVSRSAMASELSRLAHRVAASWPPKLPPPRNNKFVVTLKGQPRGNGVDILVNGKGVYKTLFTDWGGTMITDFRGVVQELREQYPDAKIELPGGLKDEKQIVRDQRILLDPSDPVLQKGGF